MALFTIVVTGGYLALAALGAGGIGAFLARPQFIALSLMTLALTAIALFTVGHIVRYERGDRTNRWRLSAYAIIAVLGGYFPAYTDRIGFWTLDGEQLRRFGVFLFAAGGTLRVAPIFVLRHRFRSRVAIQPGHTLVTTGIYATIRHPSYLGMLVMTLGCVLAFRSGVGLLLVVLTLVPLLSRITSEEKLRQTKFGAEYDSYRARTWRLVPFLPIFGAGSRTCRRLPSEPLFCVFVCGTARGR
jgi:protein-S-isoprenylcysteine O-methyltransferase Ste14